MKKEILLVLCVLMAAMMACSFGSFDLEVKTIRGSGNVITEERPVEGFDNVSFEGLGRLVIEQGEVESLTVEADDNIISKITTEVRGDRLVIGMEKGTTVTGPVTLRFNLVVKNLENLDLSGLGDVDLRGYQGEQLKIDVSGGGDLDLEDLELNVLDINLSGLGGVKAYGTAESQSITISGGGSYRADDLESKSAKINISGLGDATLWAEESLDVVISGGGNVEYYGNPKVSQEISGLGQLENLGSR